LGTRVVRINHYCCSDIWLFMGNSMNVYFHSDDSNYQSYFRSYQTIKTTGLCPGRQDATQNKHKINFKENTQIEKYMTMK